MLKALIVPIALFAAACSPPAAQDAAKSDASMDMAESAAPAQAGPIVGVGTVTAVDATAGTVSLDHEAIAAISWPAMSMQFRVENPGALQGIAVGDHVSFELKSATETQVITAITEQ
jgi:Cu(I)/Ag(I) efflux system protein CusF